jgi:uncharacterized protein (DUF1684 family)
MGMTVNGNDAYRKEIETWRAGMEQRLKAEDGWLTVAGLFWLREGDAPFGSDSSNAIVLPAPVPARAGILRMLGEQVRLIPNPGVAVIVRDQPVLNETLLESDAEGPADIASIGDVTFFVIKRGDRYGIRVKDKNSPIRQNFTHRNWFPVKPEFKVEGTFTPYAKPVPRRIPTVLDGVVEDHLALGTIDFSLQGQKLTVEAVKSGSSMQIVFRDSTAGKQTYAAARFLVTENSKGGKVTLDFNRAYNPPCAFNPYTTCPLPVKQNILPLAIEAGEMKYDH